MTSETEMIVERDILVPMRDGHNLVANLYRPKGNRKVPVLVTSTPYGKDVHVQNAFPQVWNIVQERYSQILEASSGKHMIWECIDPEVWVVRGYAVLQIDSRGFGKSAGYMDPNSPQEAIDGVDAIDWVCAQPWCTGDAGCIGLGYITCTNWRIAAMKPEGLKAAIFCQGTAEFYRDRVRNDGLYNNGFNEIWYREHALPNQHGNHDTDRRDMYAGVIANGSTRLFSDVLTKNRSDYLNDLISHPLRDAWITDREAVVEQIGIPSLVIANWGGLGLQLRGTVTGWERLASEQKWLKVEAGNYFFTFFMPDRVAYLARFFDHFIKGADNGWEEERRVQVAVRTLDDGISHELNSDTWPLSEAHWTNFYFGLEDNTLSSVRVSDLKSSSYVPGESELCLYSAPFEGDTTIAGPVCAKLWISCETEDTDLFLTLRVLSPDNKDASFSAATDPCAAPSQGWLRASQRELAVDRTKPMQPVHAHTTRQPLIPGNLTEVDVSIWPTGLMIPKGHRLALVIGGSDFTWPADSGKLPQTVQMVHTHANDRPAAIYTGRVTVHTGPDHAAHLSLPVIKDDITQRRTS